MNTINNGWGMDDLSGQVIRGYELRQWIGGGGFGNVYRAYQPALQREVAVKVIHSWLAHDLAFTQRFEMEARLIARLEHPYIVTIHEYWSDPTGAYIVMRWLRGGSLREQLKKAPLAPEIVAKLLPQVTSALALAHRHKIIHRDIKPDNLLLDEEGNVYLSDFGIAKDLTSNRTDTPTGEVMGTPDYLAPEQFMGDSVTPQTDIYSLGLVLYELLTGALPFGKLTPHELAHKRMTESLPPLQAHRPDLPNHLNEVLQWATHRNLYSRCADALALAEAFQRALDVAQSTHRITVQTGTPSPSEIGPTPIFTPILISDLKAKFYQKAELILEKPRRLIGRDAVLAHLHQLLDENERILLCGMGGMGKTSLAATIADQRIADGKGPVIWLEAGIESADTLFEAIARAFDQQQAIARVAGDERTTVIRELLLDKKALLVLDNVWNERALFHLQKAVPPSLPLLVTSRHKMPLDGMVVEIGELDADSAHQLLAHHARRDLAADARALCEKLGNHPFALEIAGKRLKVDSHLNPAQLLASIADAPHDLKLPQNFADVGREGIKDLLDDSINKLPPSSHATFLAMGSLFAPQASDDLFALVLGREAETSLANLQQRGLIERQPKAERRPAHYRLHDLTYSYARVLFVNAGRDHQPVIEAAQRYLTAHAQDYDDLEFEQMNILGAAKAAQRKGDSKALIEIMKVLATGGYFDARGHSLLFLERLDDAIEAAGELTPEYNDILHALLVKKGDAYRDRSDLPKALQAYQEGEEHAPNPQLRTMALVKISGVRFRQNMDDYDTYIEKAYQLAKANNDDFVLARVIENRGIFAATKGDLPTAHQYLIQALEVSERLGDTKRLFFALYNLGVAKLDLQQYADALVVLQRAAQIAHKNDSHLWSAIVGSAQARGHHGLGERDKAQVFFDSALGLYKELGDEAGIQWAITFAKENGYQIGMDIPSANSNPIHDK